LISTGSSPHTRGTLKKTLEGSAPARFIPAYAGNTQCTPFRFHGFSVHPRIRGEHKCR